MVHNWVELVHPVLIQSYQLECLEMAMSLDLVVSIVVLGVAVVVVQ